MRKHETAVCGTARTVVWEVGKCENRRQMPFMISIYLLPDCLSLYVFTLDCRATRDAERGGESREDADGNL